MQQPPPGHPPGFAPPPGYGPQPGAMPPQAQPSPYAPQAAPPGYAPPQGGYPPPAAPPGYAPPAHAPGGYPPPPAAAGYPPPGYGAPAAPPGRGMPQRGRAFDGNAVAASNMAGTRYPLFLDGEYIVLVEKTLVTQRKPCFVLETKIITSTNPNRPTGSNAAWVQKLDDPDVAYPSIKRCAACALGCATEQQIVDLGVNLGELLNACADPDQAASAIYAPNPLAGRYLAVIVQQILTKKNTPFTRHDWYPYVPQAGG